MLKLKEGERPLAMRLEVVKSRLLEGLISKKYDLNYRQDSAKSSLFSNVTKLYFYYLGIFNLLSKLTIRKSDRTTKNQYDIVSFLSRFLSYGTPKRSEFAHFLNNYLKIQSYSSKVVGRGYIIKSPYNPLRGLKVTFKHLLLVNGKLRKTIEYYKRWLIRKMACRIRGLAKFPKLYFFFKRSINYKRLRKIHYRSNFFFFYNLEDDSDIHSNFIRKLNAPHGWNIYIFNKRNNEK